MKTDTRLKKEVLAELEWDPSINANHVGVAVNEGVVRPVTGVFCPRHFPCGERTQGRVVTPGIALRATQP